MMENSIYIDRVKKVKPCYNDDAIQIAFVSDDSFVDFLGVAINSIIIHADRKKNYDIIVITTDITNIHIQDILSLKLEKDNISIRFAFVTRLIEDTNFVVSNNYNKFTYYRLLLPEIVESMDRILYLDADIIVNYDIAELYDMDFEGNYLIGTYDVQIASWQNYDSGMKSYFEALNICKSGHYVQAGVLVFNLRKICDDGKFDDIVRQACTQKYIFNDQDLINIYFQGGIKIVNLCWNVLNLSESGLNNCREFLTGQQWKEYKIARENPKIVHFADKSFPCYQPESFFAGLYWGYAENTRFYNCLIKRAEENTRLKNVVDEGILEGKEIIQLKKLANRMLKHAPLLYKIIRRLRAQKGQSIDLTTLKVVGKAKYSSVGVLLEPGAELSGLHYPWGQGKHSIRIKIQTKNIGNQIKCKIMAGCRHILLEECLLENGLNIINCNLSNVQIDVELVLENGSASQLLIKEIVVV